MMEQFNDFSSLPVRDSDVNTNSNTRESTAKENDKRQQRLILNARRSRLSTQTEDIEKEALESRTTNILTTANRDKDISEISNPMVFSPRMLNNSIQLGSKNSSTNVSRVGIGSFHVGDVAVGVGISSYKF